LKLDFKSREYIIAKRKKFQGEDVTKVEGFFGKLGRVLLLKEAGILLALIALCIFTAVFNPRFLSPFNILIVSRQIAIFGIIAIGETFVITTAGIDLSPGAVVALTGILVAWLMKAGLGIVGSILTALIAAGGIGLWHGLFVTKLRVPPFVITLGTFVTARGFAAVITKGWPIINLPLSFGFLWEGMIFGILPMPVVILAIVVGLSIFVLNFTVLGRYIYAVGGNIESARLSGIDVDKIRILVYIISTVLAGLVGIMIAARLSQGNPNVGILYELYAIAASVIGGTSLFGGEATIIGVLIGTSLLSVIWNSLVLLRVSAYWHQVVVGLVLVGAVTTELLREERSKRYQLKLIKELTKKIEERR